ncbi:uncharacterized protein [Eulemur rufifrons]|uniref:uncharacterized protein n=1 Tax=Eulemur rufifrons TaxID=859984 RepID=UPI003743AF88
MDDEQMDGRRGWPRVHGAPALRKVTAKAGFPHRLFRLGLRNSCPAPPSFPEQPPGPALCPSGLPLSELKANGGSGRSDRKLPHSWESPRQRREPRPCPSEPCPWRWHTKATRKCGSSLASTIRGFQALNPPGQLTAVPGPPCGPWGPQKLPWQATAPGKLGLPRAGTWLPVPLCPGRASPAGCAQKVVAGSRPQGQSALSGQKRRTSTLGAPRCLSFSGPPAVHLSCGPINARLRPGHQGPEEEAVGAWLRGASCLTGQTARKSAVTARWTKATSASGAQGRRPTQWRGEGASFRPAGEQAGADSPPEAAAHTDRAQSREWPGLRSESLLSPRRCLLLAPRPGRGSPCLRTSRSCPKTRRLARLLLRGPSSPSIRTLRGLGFAGKAGAHPRHPNSTGSAGAQAVRGQMKKPRPWLSY